MTGVAWWALGVVAAGPVAIPIAGLGPPGPRPPGPPVRTLRRSDFGELAGWAADPMAPALAAFVASCGRGPRGSGGGLAAALEPVLEDLCTAARAVPRGDDAAARAFFEREFSPWAVGDRGRAEGLLTGYYEPELRGDRRRHGPYVHPLYYAPADRMVVDLGRFRRDLSGRRITGMIRGGRFRPYWDRAEIESGALRGRGLELVWVEDPVALFFLQIQGSGRIRLPDGSVMRVGYSGQNGHDYTSIGRVLVERGEIAPEDVSLQTIRAWLESHPREATAVMDANRSYVFFRKLDGRAPVGAEGTELEAGRSLAVDPSFLVYGLPLWVESSLPAAPEIGRTSETPLATLAVAQDTGGAIRGPVRADLFLGAGTAAEATAGRMKQPLRLWLLWPRSAGPPEAPPADPPPGP